MTNVRAIVDEGLGNSSYVVKVAEGRDRYPDLVGRQPSPQTPRNGRKGSRGINEMIVTGDFRGAIAG